MYSQPGHGAAVASIVCGIVGLVLSIVFIFVSGGVAEIVPIILGVVGLVMASVAKNAGNMEGIRTAGFVLSILALVFGALFFLTCGLCTICAAKEVSDTERAINNLLNY